MTTGIQETIVLENNGFTVELSVAETYDMLENISDVSVGMRIKSAYTRGNQYLSGVIRVNGKELVRMDSTLSTHHVPIAAYNTWYTVIPSGSAYTGSPWTMGNISHNTDGSGEISLELELRGYGDDNYLHLRVATIRTIVLTHIPRASTVGASDARIGAVSTVSVVRRSADYTHCIAYRFGALSGYLQADGTLSASPVKLTQTSIPFRLPESFYGQIPNSPTGTCTLSVNTYSGQQQIGDTQSTEFTVTADKTLSTPEIFGRVEDTNPKTLALTGDRNILVRYASTALCTVAAMAKNGAAIVSKRIGNVEVPGNTLTMNTVRSGVVTFACTDSRGYTASLAVENPLVPYIHLAAGVAANRTDPTSGNGKLTVTGNWFHGSFGAANNTLTVTYTVNGGIPATATVTTDGDVFRAEALLTGLDYRKAHTVAVTVSDRLQTVTKSVTVGKGIPVFHWGEADFQFQVPVSLNGNPLAGLGNPVEDADAVNFGTFQTGLSGKAPAGHGLGGNAVAIGSLNNAAAFGLTTSIVGTPDFKRWECLTIPYDKNEATQIAWRSEETSGSILTASRRKRGGFWGKWSVDSGYGSVKLWENTDRTSSFSPQTVSLDLSGYEEVLVYFCLNHDRWNQYMVSGRCPVGEVLLGQFTWADDGITYHRSAQTSGQGIRFNEGFYYGSLDNRSCIPYRIYGIRGNGEIGDVLVPPDAVCGMFVCGEVVCG